jgi:hypothetical protein
MSAGREEFYVGWAARAGAATGRRLRAIALGIAIVAIGFGALSGAGIDDPTERLLGASRAVRAPAHAVADAPALGLALDGPAAMLFVPEAPGRPAHTLMVAGDGKSGPGPEWAALRGQWVAPRGVVVRRGSIDMLILSEPIRRADTPAGVAAAPPRAVDIGVWRIVGEICDGKCVAGAMRPGSGIAHRACAILCLDGDIPAVFVPTGTVAGHAHLVLADETGGPPLPAFRPWVGRRVELEGRVERVGDIAIFRAALPHP